MDLQIISGLVLRLESDRGLSADGTTVTSWEDASGLGNDLTAYGDPALAAGMTPSGAPSVAFDGNGDRLERLLSQSGLPSGNQDRTMFFVVNYVDANGLVAGLVYGDGAQNEAFGLTTKGKDDDLLLQGWGSSNDFDSNVDGPAQGWMVQSVVLSGGAFNHYLNGTVIDSGTHTFATDLQKLVVGGGITGSTQSELEVAAALIYDRALTQTERQQVEAFLQSKYFVDDGLNDTPIAVGESANVLPGGTIAIDVLDNDIDDGALNGSSVTIVNGPSAGTITGINPTTGAVTYASSASQPTTDSFTYTLTDPQGAVSQPATVQITVGSIPVDPGPRSLDGLSDELVATRAGLNSPGFQPISMAFLPDNRMLLLSKTGEIRIVDPESGASALFMQINNIDSGQERGLLDITLDPDFATNGYFYLYYTPDNPEKARIARFTYEDNSGGLTATADVSSEFIVWQDTDGYVACCHYGGGLDFGPDGKLWLTTSDKFQSSNPGEGPAGGTDLPLVPTSSSGKIIRVNTDGSVPDGTDNQPANPWDAPNDGINDYIWGYGLRNPFRARWDAEYGQFYIAEVGGNQQLIAHEDLHTASLDAPGAFYGWPFYEGADSTYVNNNLSNFNPDNYPDPDGGNGPAYPDDFYSAPIWSLPHNGQTASLTGGEVYRGDMFPEEWDGVYFYGDYTRDYIRYLVLDGTGTEILGDYAFKPSAQLPGTTNEVVSISVGADGALYYARIANGEIHRVIYSDGPVNDAPDIASASISPAGAPLTVTFSASVTDDESDAMSYSINFGDGSPPVTASVAANGQISVQHTYATDGNYVVSFGVSDPTHKTWFAPIAVQVGEANNPPEVTSAGANPTVAQANVTQVSFSATLFDPDGDTLDYTWIFGDGNSVSGTAASGATINTTHTYSFDGAYSAYLQIDDGEFTDISDTLEIQVGEATEVPVTNGLNLLLQSDIKIGLSTGNTVVSWLDGSGQGNNLFALGDPQLVQGSTPTGQPSIVFDGAGDLLQRVNATDTIFNLPTGNTNRTMFLVVKYVDANGLVAGLVYGDGAQNESFGLTTKGKDDDLLLQGWGSSNDFDSNVDGPAQGWLVQSVVLDGGMFDHYLNGGLIDSGTHTFATDLQKLVVGGGITGTTVSELEVAAALIYDRALTQTERQQVESFLQSKYITGGGGPNLPADAVNDSYGTSQNTPLSVNAAAGLLFNDSDPEDDPFVVTGITDQPDNGSLSWNPNGSFIYTPNAGFTGPDSFTYQITGGDTASVTVAVTAPPGSGLVTAGLVAAYEDENVSIEVGTGNLVTGWLDGSGRGNDLLALGDPTQVAGATPAGRNAIVFDGAGDLLQRVSADNNTLNGLPGGNAPRTMFLVVKYVDANGLVAGLVYGDGAQNESFGLTTKGKDDDLLLQGWGVSNDFDSNVDGPTQGWLVQSVVLDGGTFNHYLNGGLIDSGNHTFATDLQKLVVGGGITGSTQSELEVAAALIYDRALTQTERQQVETYLQSKYITGGGSNLPADAVNDSYGTSQNTPLSVNLAAGLLFNDSDPEDDPFVVTGITDQPDNGSLSWNPNGSFTYTPNAGFIGPDSFTYQITGGDTALVSLTVTAPGGGLVTSGLVAAYEEANVNLGAGNLVTGWADGSGSGNYLFALGDPTQLVGATPMGRNAVAFDGAGDLLQRMNSTDTLNGLPGGNADRTMFLVANYIDANGLVAGLVYGDGAQNEAFGLTTKGKDDDLLLQGWGVSNDFDSDIDGPAQGWMVQSVVLSGGTFNHYLDGLVIDSGTHTFATDLQKLVLGGGITGSTVSELEVAAALIYDRALTEPERLQVETYLQTMYIDDTFAFV